MLMCNDGDKLLCYAAGAKRNGGGGHTVDIRSYATAQIKTLAGTIPTGTTVGFFITQVRASIATFENALSNRDIADVGNGEENGEMSVSCS